MGSKRSFSTLQASQDNQTEASDYISWYAFARQCAALERPACAQIGLGIFATRRLLKPKKHHRSILFEDAPAGLDAQAHSIVQVDTNSLLGYWTVRRDGQAQFAWLEICQRGCSGLVSIVLTTLSSSRFLVRTTHGSKEQCQSSVNQLRAATSEEGLVVKDGRTLAAKDQFASDPSRYTSYKFVWECPQCNAQFSCHLGQVRPYTMAVSTSVRRSIPDAVLNPCTWSFPVEVQWALWRLGPHFGHADFSPEIHASDLVTSDEVSFEDRDPFNEARRWFCERTDLYCRPHHIQLLVAQYHQPVVWQSMGQHSLSAASLEDLQRLEQYLKTFASGLRDVDAFEHRRCVAMLGCFGLNFDLETLARELAPVKIGAIVRANEGRISVNCVQWATLHYDDVKQMLALLQERRGVE